jgi:hypothetical protein
VALHANIGRFARDSQVRRLTSAWNVDQAFISSDHSPYPWSVASALVFPRTRLRRRFGRPLKPLGASGPPGGWKRKTVVDRCMR